MKTLSKKLLSYLLTGIVIISTTTAMASDINENTQVVESSDSTTNLPESSNTSITTEQNNNTDQLSIQSSTETQNTNSTSIESNINEILDDNTEILILNESTSDNQNDLLTLINSNENIDTDTANINDTNNTSSNTESDTDSQDEPIETNISTTDISNNDISTNTTDTTIVSNNDISNNSISENDIQSNNVSNNDTSENNISTNDVSDNDISNNDVSDNDVSDNDISSNDVSDNDISSNDISDNDIEEILVQKTFYRYIEGYTIFINGLLPENTTLQITKLDNTQAESIINDLPDFNDENITFVADATFDISLIVNDEEYEPFEHNTSVEVSIISNIINEESIVYHIDDSNQAEQINAEITNQKLTMEVDSFSTYTVGGVVYTVDTDNYSILLTGTNFNKAIKRLVNTSATYNTTDSMITSIELISEAFTSSTELQVSGEPVYAQLNGTVVEIYSAADKIYLNANSSNMFYGFQNLAQCSFITNSKIDTSNVTSINSMFSYCRALTSLDLSSWNVSNVTNMYHAFSMCNALTSMGDLSSWNVSNVTNMSQMFGFCYVLTSLDLSSWNVSNVTDMSQMFSLCKALISLNLSNWNVGNVTDMSQMFNGCNALTSVGDLSNWNVDNVTDMSWMFRYCTTLTSLDLSSWDVGNVTNMSSMFYDCEALTSLDLSSWNVSNVTDMSDMFYQCQALTSLDLNSWNVSNVADIKAMFHNCQALTSLDISSWDVSHVTDMSGMFFACQSLTSLDLSGWDMTNVTSTYSSQYGNILGYCLLTKIYLPKVLPTANVEIVLPATMYQYNTDDSGFSRTEITDMMNVDSSLLNDTDGEKNYLSTTVPVVTSTLKTGANFNAAIKQLVNTSATSSTTDSMITSIELVNEAFTSSTELQVAGEPVYARLTGTTVEIYSAADKIYLNVDSSYMFYEFRKLAQCSFITNSKIDTNNVTNMSGMFYNCRALTSLDLDSWNVENVTNMSSMFSWCRALTSVGDISSWNVGNVTNMNSMFYICEALTSLDLNSWNVDNVTDMTNMFSSCDALTVLNISSWNVGNVTDMCQMFYYCEALTSLDLSGWNVGNVTDMSSMFYMCQALTSIGNLSSWDVSNVTIVSNMFSECSALTSLDLSSWNVGNVTNMSNMFNSCQALTTLDINSWDVGNVTNMESMFHCCQALTSLDLSSWDVSNVTDMHSMFSNCNALTSIGDISSWNVSNVTNMYMMFYWCGALTTLDLSSWNVSNVTTMSDMFCYCSVLTSVGDISSWNVSNVTDMHSMFSNCNVLTSIGDISSWNVSNVTDMSYMFYYCYTLTTLDLSGWDMSNVVSTLRMLVNCQALTKIYLPKVLPTADVELVLPATMYQYNTDNSGFNNTEITDIMNVDSSLLNDTAGEKNYLSTTVPVFSSTLKTGQNFNAAIKQLVNTSASYYTTDSTVTSIEFTSEAFTSSTELQVSGREVYARLNGTTVEIYSVSDIIYLNADSSELFSKFESLTTCSFIEDSRINTSNVTNMSDMFYRCKVLTSLDLSSWNVDNVTDMHSMFSNCNALTSIGDISSWNVSNVTDMHNMFYECVALTSLDLSGWNVGNVTNMSGMFCYCYALTSLDLSGWDVGNVTDMSYMFDGCQSLTSVGNINSWDVSNVTDMSYMFSNCSTLTSLDLSSWNTENVTSTESMFDNASIMNQVQEIYNSIDSIPDEDKQDFIDTINGIYGTSYTTIEECKNKFRQNPEVIRDFFNSMYNFVDSNLSKLYLPNNLSNVTDYDRMFDGIYPVVLVTPDSMPNDMMSSLSGNYIEWNNTSEIRTNMSPVTEYEVNKTYRRLYKVVLFSNDDQVDSNNIAYTNYSEKTYYMPYEYRTGVTRESEAVSWVSNNVFTNAGMSFSGWYNDTDCTEVADDLLSDGTLFPFHYKDDNINVLEEVDIYAKWTPTNMVITVPIELNIAIQSDGTLVFPDEYGVTSSYARDLNIEVVFIPDDDFELVNNGEFTFDELTTTLDSQNRPKTNTILTHNHKTTFKLNFKDNLVDQINKVSSINKSEQVMGILRYTVSMP